MPIGIQRLNDPHPQPSSQITFVKPLPGPNEAYSKDLLERVAAICHPIMKTNHLSITTLEEHEPNREFVGRNFNAGEIIQLVLRSQSGQWLSFRTMQMVMMHELAHIMQMNHSRAFWMLRNQYVGELKQLWSKDYTGDGLWGRGQTLLSGKYDTRHGAEQDILPDHLCGGAYRSSRRRKRKRGATIGEKKAESYAEKKQRRIAKKFGVKGQTLGGDGDTRMKLEKGQQMKGKPRVANSSRGRELRVAAALARFGEQTEAKIGGDRKSQACSSGSEEESEDVESEIGAVDFNGIPMQDPRGRNMIKICGSEDQDDVDVKQEMDELRGLEPSQGLWDQESGNDADTSDEGGDNTCRHHHGAKRKPSKRKESRDTSMMTSNKNDTQAEVAIECPICSMSNSPGAALCLACSHVLDMSQVSGSWQCQSNICKDSVYRNAADCGICGVCGSHKKIVEND